MLYGTEAQKRRERRQNLAKHYYINGFSRAEIAKFLSVSQDTVKKYLVGLELPKGSRSYRKGVECRTVLPEKTWAELDGRPGSLSKNIREAVSFAIEKGF